MSKGGSWAQKFGFETAKEYIDYMTKHGLWGSDEYIKLRGIWDKRLVKEAEG